MLLEPKEAIIIDRKLVDDAIGQTFKKMEETVLDMQNKAWIYQLHNLRGKLTVYSELLKLEIEQDSRLIKIKAMIEVRDRK